MLSAQIKYWMKFSFYTAFLIASLIACTSQSQVEILRDKTPLNTYSYPLFHHLDTNLRKQYPFINFENNCFRFYSAQSPNWEHLFQDFRDMVFQKDCKLNFYHIGGSHLQADVYTHDIRTYLQSHWSGIPGERGVIFPFDLARTNNPWNYEFKSPNNWHPHRSVNFQRPDGIDFGLMGVVVETPDSVVEIKFRYDKTDVKPGFTRLRVYHNKGLFPYDLNFGPDEILIVNKFRNETLGYTETVFADAVDTFNLQLTRLVAGPYNLQISGFQLSNALPGISYTAIGINGAGLYTYIANRNFDEQLKEYPPDFFAFSVGTNDANVPYASFDPDVYKKNLETMMMKVLTANPDCAILLTVPNDAGYKKKYLNKNIARQREVIIELAKKYQCPVWDFYGIMGELGSSRIWKANGLMRADLVHFTAPGYHFKAELFVDAFEKWLEQMEKRKYIN
ncbi:GDSL-like Lipase/Acylhydrolase [compost metagenome]